MNALMKSGFIVSLLACAGCGNTLPDPAAAQHLPAGVDAALFAKLTELSDQCERLSMVGSYPVDQILRSLRGYQAMRDDGWDIFELYRSVEDACAPQDPGINFDRPIDCVRCYFPIAGLAFETPTIP